MIEPEWAQAEGVDPRLAHLWSERSNAKDERQLWLLVLEVQIREGVRTPGGWSAYWAYNEALDLYSPTRAKQIERVTRHDIKARIEHYNEQAGHEVIHRGLTSHDLVDNVNQWKIRRSLLLLAELHNRPALAEAADAMVLRGLKGPVGTSQDLLDLMGSPAFERLEHLLRKRWGFTQVSTSIGQIYPRSWDLGWVDAVVSDLVSAGRSSSPWYAACLGYRNMLASLAIGQWNEGDVSGSVTRRVALPGLLFAASLAHSQGDAQ